MHTAPSSTKTTLTIAGFDPSSGAGISADLAVMSAHGYFGTAAITALTVQSTLGVAASHLTDPKILAHTLGHLSEDLTPAGIKIGMLATEAHVRIVTAFLRDLLAGPVRIPVVLDPVLISSSGHHLLDKPGIDVLRTELVPLVDWVTPNVAELAVLLGPRLNRLALARPLLSKETEIETAACELAATGRHLNVVVTGGDANASDFVWLADGHSEWLRGQKIDSHSTHGTGCAFSTALLCCLTDGVQAIPAVQSAKHYVTEAIRRATPLGHGTGPMNLLWPLHSTKQ